jgi:hypothetical protein
MSELDPAHLSGNTEGTFERCAVPAAGFGRRDVGGRQKVEQQGIGLCGAADRVVRQNELPEGRVASKRAPDVTGRSWKPVGSG